MDVYTTDEAKAPPFLLAKVMNIAKVMIGEIILGKNAINSVSHTWGTISKLLHLPKNAVITSICRNAFADWSSVGLRA